MSTTEQVWIGQGNFGEVVSVTYSPKGNFVAAGGSYKLVVIWDAATGERLQTLVGARDEVRAVAFSADEMLLAAGYREGVIRLWRQLGLAEYGTPPVFSEHGTVAGFAGLFGLAFLSDGRLVFPSHDNRLVIREVQATRHGILSTAEPSASIDCGAFSSDAGVFCALAKGSAHTADRRSDVYSLGVILFELLTGERPFRGSIRMLVHQVINDEPPSPRKLNAAVPRDLETIVLKCLEKDPGKRYATAQSLADDLRRFLDNKPIDARPVTRWKRGWKWCKRNPLASGLAATVATLLLAGVLSSLVSVLVYANLATRAREKTAEALTQKQLAQEQSERSRRLLYSSDMIAAFQAWEEGDVDHVTDLLLRHNEDLRGFEWYYLWKLTEAIREATKIQVSYLANDLAISPNGETLAVGLGNGTAELVDMLTRRREAIGIRKPGRRWSPTSVAYSPNGGFLAYTSEAVIVLRTLRSGDERELCTRASRVTDIAFSADGQRLLVSGMDGEVALVDVDTGENHRTYQGQVGGLNSLAISADGSCFAYVDVTGAIVICDARQGERAETIAKTAPSLNDRARIVVLAFSADGRFVAAGRGAAKRGGAAQVWDVKTGSELFSCTSFVDTVRCLTFSPDGEYVVAGSRDAVRILQLPTGREVGALKAHSGAVLSVIYLRDPTTMATASGDQTILLWDTNNLGDARTLPCEEPAVDLAFVPNSSTLACAVNDGQVCELWDTGTSRKLSSLELGDQRCNSIAVSCKGKLAVAQDNGKIGLWDLTAGKHLHTVDAHRGRVNAICFSPDGDLLASGGQDSLVKIWSPDSGNVTVLVDGHRDSVGSLAFSADGKTLASGGDDYAIILWDLQSRKPRRLPCRHRGTVSSLAFSPTEPILASGSWDYSIKLWDLSKPQVEPDTLTGHSIWVSSLLFTSDGATLFSACGHHTIKIWDVASRQLKGTLARNAGASGMSLSSDESVLAASSIEGMPFLWRAATVDDVKATAASW